MAVAEGVRTLSMRARSLCLGLLEFVPLANVGVCLCLGEHVYSTQTTGETAFPFYLPASDPRHPGIQSGESCHFHVI